MPVVDEITEIVDFLQHCFDMLDRGDEDCLISDPFFERPNGKPPFTDEEIDHIIEELDAYYSGELTARRSTYEQQAGGEITTPDFSRMQLPTARRALVEGVASIIAKHAAKQEEAART